MASRTPRQRAFAREPAEGWVPEVGDVVYVRRTSGNLSVIRSVGTVVSASLLSDMVEVRIERGVQRHRGMWLTADLRPCGVGVGYG